MLIKEARKRLADTITFAHHNLDSIEKRPQMWGTSHGVEVQYRLLLKTLLVLTGSEPRDERGAHDKLCEELRYGNLGLSGRFQGFTSEKNWETLVHDLKTLRTRLGLDNP